MGDSFYHIFTTPYLFLLTLFYGRRGVGIHNVITKIYHMSVTTLISRKMCDNKIYITSYSYIKDQKVKLEITKHMHSPLKMSSSFFDKHKTLYTRVSFKEWIILIGVQDTRSVGQD
jgi:hypothetical protein